MAQAQTLMEDQLAARLDVGRDSLVLDAGSGEGIVACHLAGQFGWRIVGIDLLEPNAQIARRNAHAARLDDRTDFVPANYLDICAASGSFDAAYTMETLVHSPDAPRTLGELYRVLRPGGRLVCAEYTVPDDADMDDRMRRILAQIVSRGGAPSLPFFVNGSFADLFRAAGFVDVRVDDLTDRIVPMLRLFSRLGRGPYWLARRLGLTQRLVNAQFGVEWYRHRDRWRYVMATATKP